MTPTVFTYPLDRTAFTLTAPHAIGDGVLAIDSAALLPGGFPNTTRNLRVSATRSSDGARTELKATGRSGLNLTGVSACSGYTDIALAAGDSLQVRPSAGYHSDAYDAIHTLETATVAATPAANTVYADSGGSGNPAFRALAAADVPAIPESRVTGLVSDLAAKAPTASPPLTGTPTAPTPLTADNSTALATTAFVKAQGYGPGTVTSVSASVPSGLGVSVSNTSTTPLVAITTALTGIVKGTGSGFAAAVSGTDYYAPGGAIASSDLTSVPAANLTGSVAVARLPVMVGSGVSHAAGIVPDPGASAGTTHYLREDGTFAVPPDTNSGGTVTSVGLAVPAGLSVAGSPVIGSGTLTVSTTLSGLVKGTGTGFTTAAAGTDYLAPAGSGAALTGITADQVGAAHALVPTAAKTANYTAATGDFVPVDTTSGSVTITLPAAPADRSVVAVKQVTRGGTNTVSVACGGSDHFNTTTGATSATLTLQAQGLLLQYQASTSLWFVTADDIPLSQLDVRHAQLAAANTFTHGIIVQASGSEVAGDFQAVGSANVLNLRDNAGTTRSAFDSNAYGFVREAVFVLGAGTPVVTGSDVAANYFIVPRAGKVIKAFIAAKTAPTGAALIVDLLRSTDGGSTFTSFWNVTTANRVQLAAAAKTGSQSSFDNSAVTEGDLIRVDVTQVGSTVAGQGVTVVLLLSLRNQ